MASPTDSPPDPFSSESCIEIRSHFDDYLDGVAEPDTLRSIRFHLSYCAACRQELERLETLRAEISPGWLWDLRVLTVLFAVGTGALAVLNYLLVELIDPWIFGFLPFFAAYGLVLWHLRRNPPEKLGLAIALGMGGVMFGFYAYGLFRSPRIPQPLIVWIIPLTAAAYSSCAIRIYYLLPQEKGDRRKLLAGLALVGLGCVFSMMGFRLSTDRPYKAIDSFMISLLGTIKSAELTYASTYSGGYSSSLRELGPPAKGEQPSASAAGLIESELATGRKAGYAFTFTPGPRDAKGHITTYTLTARLLKGYVVYEARKYKNYYSDETGVIRATDEDRPATAQDPPLGG